jgi:hypothetical protein
LRHLAIAAPGETFAEPNLKGLSGIRHRAPNRAVRRALSRSVAAEPQSKAFSSPAQTKKSARFSKLYRVNRV